MKHLLTALLVLGLGLGFGLAQEDTGGADHGDTQDHSEMDHSDMDHSGHDMAEMDPGVALNRVQVGDSTLTLEPLVSADGVLTLGVSAAPGAALTLRALSPSGVETALEAVPVTAMTGEHGAHEDHEDMAEGEHEEDQHGSEMAGEHGEHERESGAEAAMDTVSFRVGLAEEGVWRFSGSLNGETLAFPVSVYRASTATTELYLVMAPSPTLTGRGAAEAFIYAFREGESIHSGMTVVRAMEGMQHSTDEETLALVHNHFNDRYNAVLGYGPMANQSPLTFAMAGTWDVNVTILGETEERVSFRVDVLEE